MLYKCIRPIPYDINVNELPPELGCIDYTNMMFKEFYKTQEGNVYLKTLDGSLTICVSEMLLERNFIEVEEIEMDKDKQYESDDKMVSHPSHYQSSNGIECIDAIEAATENLIGIEAVDTGNIIKYAWRWDEKGTPIRDVEKIIWFATHLLNHLKDKENGQV